VPLSLEVPVLRRKAVAILSASSCFWSCARPWSFRKTRAEMTKSRAVCAPVVQDDAVVGVVSIGDSVKWIISNQAQVIQELEGYITGAYPR